MARVTISEIAKAAGVSKTAVSFAFNDPSRLPEDTVKRILAVADELGYFPNPVARSLTSKRTGNLGLLFPQPMPTALDNPYMLELLRGVGQVCDANGYNMVLVSPVLGSMRQAVSEAVVDGFLTIGLEHDKATIRLLEQRAIPYVMVDSEPYPGAACVNIDDTSGAYEVMEHVLDNGHRDILILGIESGKYGNIEEYVGTIQHRVAGYRAALQEYGLDIDGKQVRLIECPCTAEGGREALESFQMLVAPPTAIVAMADIIALGVLEAVREQGIRVPEDLSVVGYDDLPIARWLNPPLTTVQQPTLEKGRAATRLLLQVMAGSAEKTEVVLPTRLVKRSSVAAAAR